MPPVYIVSRKDCIPLASPLSRVIAIRPFQSRRFVFSRMEARRMVSSRSCPPGNVQVCPAMVFASSWGRFLRTNGIAHQPLSYRCREMVILDACLGGFPLMIQSVPLHAFGFYMRQCPTLQHSHCCPVEDKGGRTVKLTQNGNQGDRPWESERSIMGISGIGHGNQWDRS